MAIARGIAGLDAQKEIKDCLSALLNLELLSSKSSPVNKAAYIREIESRFESWASSGDKTTR